MAHISSTGKNESKNLFLKDTAERNKLVEILEGLSEDKWARQIKSDSGKVRAYRFPTKDVTLFREKGTEINRWSESQAEQNFNASYKKMIRDFTDNAEIKDSLKV